MLSNLTSVIDKGATAASSAAALMSSLKQTEGVAAKEITAEGATLVAQEAKRSEESSVEQALCANLNSIFTRESPKFGKMMVDTIGKHLAEEQAIKDGINSAVVAALTPKIKEAIESAMGEMTNLNNTNSIYNMLKKKIDEAFDNDIRPKVFDNINLLSKDALAEMIEKLNVQNSEEIEDTLTTPVVESELSVETPAESESISATAEAVPITPIVEDVEAVKGGKRRTRKARCRATKKSGGATKRRRQRILTLA